jgi:small subunit ribosomal protein S35
LSTTPPRPAAGDDAQDFESEFDPNITNPGQFLKQLLRDDKITEDERQLATRMLEDWKKVSPKQQSEIDALNQDILKEAAPLRRPAVAKKDSFWHDEECDPDLITDEIGEDDFEEDDMMALGHAKLEEHREFREYARLAVWEMPLLSSKPARTTSRLR